MGSVKDLVTPENVEKLIAEDEKRGRNRRTALEKAAQRYRAPTPRKPGEGVWRGTGGFSVADLKGALGDDVEVPQKNYVLAMTAARYLEATSSVTPSCYVGMLDNDGEQTDATKLLDRGELSDLVVVRLVNTPLPGSEEAVAAYHHAITEATITAFVVDAEFIFRAGLPLGSSSFKKMFALAERENDYERVSTYADTVALLNEIRGSVAMQGLAKFPDLQNYLQGLKLDEIPNPGALLPEVVFDFTTKFAIGGDVPLSAAEVQERIGGSEDLLSAALKLVRESARHQTAYCQDRGIINMDGKVELAIINGKPYLTDFACTVDENRLMIVYEEDGAQHLLPTNKEAMRAVFRKYGVYDAIAQAKKQHGDRWRGNILAYVDRKTLVDATRESVELMGKVIGTVGNLLLGKTVFDTQPIRIWAHDLLPYASRMEK